MVACLYGFRSHVINKIFVEEIADNSCFFVIILKFCNNIILCIPNSLRMHRVIVYFFFRALINIKYLAKYISLKFCCKVPKILSHKVVNTRTRITKQKVVYLTLC